MNDIIQKQMPLIVNMINLIAVTPTVLADPVLDCALASLIQQVLDTWEKLEAIYETAIVE
jgi:hypothetical protein